MFYMRIKFFLQFEDVSGGGLIFKLSIQESQPETIIQGTMYSCYKTDNIVFYTEYDKGYNINTSYHGVYNMKVYRDAVDQNENNGNPVLLNILCKSTLMEFSNFCDNRVLNKTKYNLIRLK